MNIKDKLIIARERLIDNGIDGREARLLLAYAMGIKADDLIKFSEVSDEVENIFNELLQKRISGIPYAYITGVKEFMKLDFQVNENVLIPRPETEMLVEEALKKNADSILDMCTGSGCIAISIAYYNKNAKITAVDISEKALEVAEENAKHNNVHIEFVKSDLFENVHRKYDLIVSNPPYISSNDMKELQKEVQKEPHIALDGGKSGVIFYEKIAEKAKDYLKENGNLIFEIGYNQGQAVKEILEKNDYENIEIKKDLSGNDRVVLCIK